ncbi:DUF262 domain-containing protein [Aestuariibaculum sediminum]|uniref:DUF262 domain-containing protein n=1 Tax=Aestuariibaculum sediminum TaxID=2770637 RepID=A0A8J6QHB8_9FLAO|nr:DUF262 domain-containing protein [Aestuariibaculum sediminum]MBD0831819.1 DUF262 domain-containing protein [Aestuariibaculum sediminum]
MAYEKPITIKEAITSISDQEFILPAIQREFVWNTKQIELLFDSIMRDYPISTFLFWKVKAENIERFKFYKFLSKYHQRDKKHNEPLELSGDKDRFAILDGQQRLTSLYLGLKGSYAYKLANYNWKSNHAFPERHLYINLLNEADNNEFLYDFRFLSEDELNNFKTNFSDKYHWFKVGDILGYTGLIQLMNYITKNSLADSSKYTSEQIDFASNTLSNLYEKFNDKELINFYLEKSEELDKVLHIFIRVNSGGTKLSYSDLLLSIATAQWKEKDAREIIHKFVDQLNAIDPGFNINKDLILKSCLVLSDIKDIKFKVDNFSSENMALIESEWDDIARSINLSIQLIASFGFNSKTLTAYNAIIPIAYFIKKNNIGDELLHSSNQLDNRKLIKEWLVRALLKRVFGGTPDNLYPIYRTIISENLGKFPLQELMDRYKGTNKSLSFDEETIEHLLNTQYGSAFAYMVLSLLYPLNHNYKFHQDHIHPKKYFNNRELTKLGIVNEAKRQQYMEAFNTIGNLQLIQETENLEKNATPFKDWLYENYSGAGLVNYKNMHFIPIENDLSMDEFLEFYEERRNILKSKLLKVLNVSDKQYEVEEEGEIIEEELT